ncbi:MAG: phenylalanine--tRNA ligase subunit alpha [Planctomycetes bacterium]|nr:phenylalanine--tRNA ligase subunit alpha [Planctomycetota bacterium]
MTRILLKDQISRLKDQFGSDIAVVSNLDSLDELFRKYIGRNGLLRDLTSTIKDLSAEEKRTCGTELNQLKDFLTSKLEEAKMTLKRKLEGGEKIDYTYPFSAQTGREHPLYSTFEEIITIMERLGFEIVEGPEIEKEEYNFDFLNIPKEHPSHDIWNTFYVSEGKVLRSHTSPVQVRTMLSKKPPIKIVAPGKVYRPDTVDAGHLPVFHQLEGLYVDENVTLPHLKGTLEVLAMQLFGEVETKFRASFFPFTEPSLEMDVSCVICKKKGCPTCRYSGWIEILGAGMVNQKVFKNVGYPENKYSGFAFGLGIERITMIKYQIQDIRYLIENNFRFLKHFI